MHEHVPPRTHTHTHLQQPQHVRQHVYLAGPSSGHVLELPLLLTQLTAGILSSGDLGLVPARVQLCVSVHVLFTGSVAITICSKHNNVNESPPR
jgi:hypothetical protein